MALTAEENERYARHLSLRDIGTIGQERLKSARVLLVGVGGLGCPTAQYLAAAGIGCLGLVDNDRISLSNLQRQILYSHEDIGKLKVDVAGARLRSLNPNVVFELYPERFDSTTAWGWLRNYDLVVDASDNFATRYLINDAAIAEGKLIVFGAIDRFDSQVAVFGAAGGPCYRCLYPNPPAAAPSDAPVGVIGVVPGLTGVLMATEVIKIMLGRTDTLAGYLLTADLLACEFQKRRVSRRQDCPVCG